MKHSARFKKLVRLFKLAAIGSAVITRTAAGSAMPEQSLQHELAWMSVREGLSDASQSVSLTADARRLVGEGFGKDFDVRVRSSYRSITPEGISQLDALWMDRLAEGGASAEVVDAFLAARSVAMPDLMNFEPAGPDDTEKWRAVARVFKRAPGQYDF